MTTRRRPYLLLAVPVVAFSVLTIVSTGKPLAGLIVAAVMIVCLLLAWALTARDGRRRGRPSPLDAARDSLDVSLVRTARAEHGESAGITEVRRQVPSLTYEQAVELHRYV